LFLVEVGAHVLFWLVMLAGVAIIPFGIPGTFVIVANALVYAWLTDFVAISWGFLALLLGIAVLAEVVEFFLGAATAGKYGASKVGMLGAMVGGIVGAIWATPILPLIGTLIGAFAGAFAGAALFEYLATRDFDKSLRVGFGAFLGSVGGKLTKIAVAVAMAVMVGFRIY